MKRRPPCLYSTPETETPNVAAADAAAMNISEKAILLLIILACHISVSYDE